MYKDLLDYYILIPIFGKILLSIILPNIFEARSIILFTTIFTQLILQMIPNIIKIDKICDCINIKAIIKAFSDGSIAYSIGIIFPYLLQIIPMFSPILNVMYSIPIIGESILWTLFYIISYILINMVNQEDKINWCKPTNIFGQNMTKDLFFSISLIFAILINIYED